MCKMLHTYVQVQTSSKYIRTYICTVYVCVNVWLQVKPLITNSPSSRNLRITDCLLVFIDYCAYTYILTLNSLNLCITTCLPVPKVSVIERFYCMYICTHCVRNMEEMVGGQMS